jgi:hypothetical protein
VLGPRRRRQVDYREASMGRKAADDDEYSAGEEAGAAGSGDEFGADDVARLQRGTKRGAPEAAEDGGSGKKKKKVRVCVFVCVCVRGAGGWALGRVVACRRLARLRCQPAHSAVLCALCCVHRVAHPHAGRR